MAKWARLAIHHHRFGVDAYLYQDGINATGYTGIGDREVAAALGIDFEPDREEYIDITSVDLDSVRTIKAWTEDESHGDGCAMRIVASAECTCGKTDYLTRLAEIPDEEG